MKTLTIIVAVLALFGCQPEREAPQYGLSVKRVTFEPDPFDPNGYMVNVTMLVTGESVAQEISINGKAAWLEHLSVTEWRDDLHRMHCNERRDIVTYPASADGAAHDNNGVAIIWADPLKVQTIPFLAARPAQGCIVSADYGRTIHWSIVSDDLGVTVTIDGRPTFYAK